MRIRILLGGASGFIGSRLRSSLVSKGHEVIAVSRRPAPTTVTWNAIKQSGLPQCHVAVNLAGEPIMGSPMRRWNSQFENDLRSSRIGTNQVLVEAIAKSSTPPKVFLSSSAIGYYTPNNTVEYNEDSTCSSSSFTQRLCSDWEKSANLPSPSSTRVVTIRIGLVLGRGGGSFEQMKWPFWFGLGGTIGSGDQLFPWIHVDDTVGIIEHVIQSDTTQGILNAVAPGIVTNHEFTKALGGAMRRPTIFGIPAFVFQCLLHQERATMLLQGVNVAPKRTLESGYTFKYPDIKSAIAELIQ